MVPHATPRLGTADTRRYIVVVVVVVVVAVVVVVYLYSMHRTSTKEKLSLQGTKRSRAVHPPLPDLILAVGGLCLRLEPAGCI